MSERLSGISFDIYLLLYQAYLIEITTPAGKPVLFLFAFYAYGCTYNLVGRILTIITFGLFLYTAALRAVAPPLGLWYIAADAELFFQSLVVEFYLHGDELRAKKVKKGKSKDARHQQKGQSLRRSRSIIWNLREKNGEYLYGWIRIDAHRKTYRCKLWRRNGKVFLRIYTRPIYTTYQLSTYKK